MRPPEARERVREFFLDGRAHCLREFLQRYGLSEKEAYAALYRGWKEGLLLRTKKPILQSEKVFHGRNSTTSHIRPYHLYIWKTGVSSLFLDGLEYVPYSIQNLDPRGGGVLSKAKMILNFLKEHSDKAWFSREIVNALKDKGVKIADVMSAARRYAKKDMLYIRGYKTDRRQTPFQQGFLLTWLDKTKPWQQAIDGALVRTDVALDGKASQTPIAHRIRRIRNIVYETSRLGEVVSVAYLQNTLGCTDHEMDGALRRATELYSEIREVKLFNAYRYLHHTCLEGTDLEAALEMKMNYIRMTQGRMNRIGHNYESAVEWFVDRFTTSAQFLTQNHREAMDPRRITIHLLKPVGRRRNNAELDRVWTVKPNAFGQPITYALECKFGLVDKSDIDDLLEVLKWSTEFGYDAPDGRRIKNGVVGVFAGSVFNPKERVQYRDGKVVNLATYAARMNIELYKTAEFNSLLHNRGVEKTVTIQKICRASRNEAEVRTILTKMWDKPEEAETIIGEVLQQNKDVYALEEELEEKGSKHPSQTGPSASPDPSPEPYRRELAVPVL